MAGHETAEYAGHTFIRILGSGNFGVTKLFRNDTTGEQVAVKFLKRGKQIHETVAYVEREILNHMQLSGHPNVVAFKEVFLTPDHLAIAMEFAAGGELFDRIVAAGRFSEDVARYFFQQLISGVAWCHSNGVCHRDLKLENSLLDKALPDSAVLHLEGLVATRPRLKICDFGYSKSAVFDSQPKSTVGTPAYIAPEVLNRKEYDGEIADVWSCGVTLYVMLVGAYPFEDPDDPRNFKKTIERIVDVNYCIPPDVRLSRECLNLLQRIFEAEPAQRISLAQIKQHPWFVRNLPQELQDLSMDEQAPQFEQSEDDIRQLIIAACALEGGRAQEQPKQDLLMEEYRDQYVEGDSVEDRYVDAYFDNDAVDDELMYMRSTAGQATWGQPAGYQRAAGPSGRQAGGEEQPGSSSGEAPSNSSGAGGGAASGTSSMERRVIAGLGGLGIGGGAAAYPHGAVDPDLAYELDDFDEEY